MARMMTPATRADRMYSAGLFGLGAAFVAYGGGLIWSLVAVVAVVIVAALWELSLPWRVAHRERRHGAVPPRIPGVAKRAGFYVAALCVVAVVGFSLSAVVDNCDPSTYECDLEPFYAAVWGFGSLLLGFFAIAALELQFLRRRNRARAMGPAQ